MPDHIKMIDFKPHLNEPFKIELDDGESYILTLVSVAPLASDGQSNGTGRQSFTLVFQHPRTDAYLLQRIYTLEHADLGELNIFLVPLGPSQEGMRYEAVFN